MLLKAITMTNQNTPVFRRRAYLKITAFGFALTALWQSLHSIVLPLLLLDFVPESDKNTYLGLMTLVGLLLAMFVQPIAGVFSDRSGSRLGRRRPFILFGGIAALVIIPGIGLAGTFTAIFAVYCLLQIATNTAQGPFQAFIPEMVPETRRGLASGIKALLETVGGVIMVVVSSVLMGRYSSGEGSIWLWLVLGILWLIMLAAIFVTMITVKEIPAEASSRNTSLLRTLYRTVTEILSNRNIRWFLASRLLVYMAFTTIQQFALYFLRDVIGVADPAAATRDFLILAVIGMLVVVWPAGFICDRIGRKTVTIVSGIMGAAGVGIIAFSHEYNTILWAAVLIGIAIGAFNAANWALATDLVTKGEEARYLGVANMATAGGAALARAIGPAIDYFNRRTVNLGYDFMLIVCVAYFVIGSALVLKIRQPRPGASSP
jgi:Na+/melibiose symporter-like transporter